MAYHRQPGLPGQQQSAADMLLTHLAALAGAAASIPQPFVFS